MRILVISYDFRPNLGGVGTCAYELACSLAKNSQNKVFVLAKSQKDDDLFDKNSPLKTIRVPLSDTAILSLPKLILSMRKCIKEHKIDVVICMLWMPSGLAMALGKAFKIIPSIPYYVFAHGVEVLESKHTLKKRMRSMLSPLKSFTFKKAKKAFCVSHFTANLLKEVTAIEPQNVQVVFNGVNPHTFYPKVPSEEIFKSYELEDKKVLLTITRLEDYKGVDSMIEALRFLRDEKIVYLVCGSGPDKERLEQLVAERDLKDKVIFCGRISDEELIEYYNRADINVLLSRYDEKTPNFEGFGLVFLEAAACGTPSLAGNTGGIPDAVIDQKTGLLVNPLEPIAVAQKLKELLNQENYPNYSSQCLEHATKNMTWDHMAQRLSEAL